jgi:uncharacterized membrane protein
MKHDLIHWPTFRLNSGLFLLFALLAVGLWLGMPERYPVHFDLAGNATRWAERNPAEWILIVALSTLSFGKAHLFQRFLFNDPNSTLINVPCRKQFQGLPVERKVPVIRRVNRMLGLINTGMLLLFIAIMLLVYYTAHNPASPATALASRAVLVLVVLIVVVPLLEVVQVCRMIRRKVAEEAP